MVFSSNIFLFLFLPLFLAVYYLAPERLRAWIIVGGSWLFYAWWRVDFLLLFVAVTFFNWWIGLRIASAGQRTPTARRWMIFGVVADLGVLGYFKYANFGVDSLNALLGAAGSPPLELAAVLLPIGISFYTFESISYIVDVYRGDCKPTRGFVDFAAFVALFPHLIAGPVFRYKDLDEQLRSRTHTLDKFAEGSVRFMQGFIKKVFIADSIAPLADAAFALQDPTTADAWLGTLAYTAQLYFDFSGYSDMAIGLALLMGFRFTENFNQPYISQSITEFWRRWHISLSNWLRDYLYISLGGNRHGALRTDINKFLTMLLGGLWHGANWTFVLWGVWHGAILAAETKLGTADPKPRQFRVHRWALTFLLVMLGWVMFRSANVAEAARMYAAMFSFDGLGFSDLYESSITRLQLATLALAFAVIAVRGLRFYVKPLDWSLADWRKLSAVSLLIPLFLLSVLRLSAQSYSPFLYFQF